ncbi:hypothetical protein BUALT_Bualt09G0124000 [Buddleja alternifolia]|uniref:Alpha 1,4-glycosyltransferase domain-containing protein n=1 Tax=Buddleja alternifolia TaxID=168488 RepID=A0AAV6X3E8_9LAMI|nr:hypothetical protein BUALT_Bualt09G0124000 [Buddleja alternifolia]
MIDSVRYTPVKCNIFSTITVALIILALIYADSIISNFSLHLDAFENGSNHHHLQTHQRSRVLRIKSTGEGDNGYLMPRFDVKTSDQTIIEELGFFETFALAKNFDSRVRTFFGGNKCKVQVFMTWISPVDSFGEREFFGLESLFETNPRSCLIILSNTMDSKKGNNILKPLIDKGFNVEAISPDLWTLFKNTPAEDWFNDIKNGNKDSGEIPLAQNLSNLIRLSVLYKYGGIYFDTDFIFLRDFSGLRNSIGAQSTDMNGNWTRLNNAVLIFDKKHPLVYKFIEEFALSFDGNKWGHNGPYLVSRVAKRGEFNFTVLPRMAFYPVSWTRVGGFFVRPNDRLGSKWIEAKIRQLSVSSYGVHLWNRQSSKLKIEEGSIISRLISDHCVICSRRHISTS